MARTIFGVRSFISFIHFSIYNSNNNHYCEENKNQLQERSINCIQRLVNNNWTLISCIIFQEWNIRWTLWCLVIVQVLSLVIKLFSLFTNWAILLNNVVSKVGFDPTFFSNISVFTTVLIWQLFQVIERLQKKIAVFRIIHSFHLENRGKSCKKKAGKALNIVLLPSFLHSI